MNTESCEVVIIGAGVVGLSLALYLAKAGQDVCVVERNLVGSEGSGRCAGGIRQNKRPPAELTLAMRSVELWQQLAQESEIDFEYRQHGNLALFWSDNAAADAAELVKGQQAAGLECYLLDRQETRDLIPAFADGYLGSVFSPSCGSAEPYRSCVALFQMARRHGAAIYEGRTVTAIQVTRGKVTGVETTTGPIHAPTVVNAAGAWGPLIARMVGLEIPGSLCRSHILVTEPLPDFIGPFVSCASFGYFCQSRAGNVLIGFGSLPVSDYTRRHTSYEAVATATRRAATIIPRLRSVAIIRTFTGFTMWTPDNMPILGPVGEPEGFYMAAEFNATGFAVGPAYGELLANLILYGRTPYPISACAPDRFDGHDNSMESLECE